MNILPRKEIPDDILKDSVLAHVAAAYFSVGKRLERKTQCSATRGFILSTLRGGTALNSNQIATLLGIDRTVVHRAIKSLAQGSEHFPKRIAKVKLLGGGGLKFTRDASGLVVNLPDKKPNDFAYALKITPA